MKPIQRISVVGAGAMGAYYAARFFDMDRNCISLIASGERRDRLGRDGFIVNGRQYLLPVVEPGKGTAPSDLVIVAVKHHHLPQAVQDMKNAVGESTLILSLMNGIESEERIGTVYGMDKVLYAVAIGIDAVREGNVVHCTRPGKLLFGEAKNPVPTERVRVLHGLFSRAGIASETPADMIRTLWWKFMINVGINQVSAVLRAPYGVFQRFPEARQLMEDAMREVIALARARNIDLSEKDMEEFLPFLLAMSPEGKTSMEQDVEAGRRTEVEMFAGKVIQMGKESNVPTPVNRMLYGLIRVMEEWRRG